MVGSVPRTVRRLLVSLFGVTLIATPAAAHSGTTHAGTPHWLLFALLAAGLGGMITAAVLVRRDAASVPLASLLLSISTLFAVFGSIGLVELQVVGQTPPELVDLYPVLNIVVSASLAFGGLLVVRLKWPESPRYALLCLVLAAWIAYPAVMPNGGLNHPLGYLIALSLPVLIGYILWTDVRPLLQSLWIQRTPRYAGVAAGVVMSVFFAFSAGTMSFNPDQGVNKPTEAFIIPYRVASPLVTWPAIEWYVPSIPFSGYLSVGSLLMMAVLGGLVGLNVAVLTQQWHSGSLTEQKQMFSGSLAASGATACCCCAPAFYGAVSVLFGSAATPIYWSFMIPSSPVGSTFFAGSVLLLLGSLVQSTGGTTAAVSSRQRDVTESPQ